jgi:deoxyadenosine/deoxycytidine kinase
MRVQLCVSGNVGSGKTTLSKAICKSFGFTYIPQRTPDPTYLTDLFSSPERWALEAQIAFLMNKTASLVSAVTAGLNVVVDRSLSEDIQIFAKMFYERGQISDRGYKTYLQVASLVLRSVPSPTILIVCECDAIECRNRIKNRGLRDFERLYPEGHIEFLGHLYNEWLRNFDQCPVFVLNTCQLDLRIPEVAQEVIKDIRTILQSGTIENGSFQIPLFSDSTIQSSNQNLKHLSLYKNTEIPSLLRQKLRARKGVKLPASPFVYIAAPFSGMSLSENKPATLFDLPVRGKINPGPYRDALLAIERSFQSYGLAAIVPHRDDSEWGKRTLRPRELVEWCSVQIQHCSLLCALPANSSGVHFELGLARAWQKPIIIFEREDGSDSTISRGLHDSWDTFRIKYKDIADIPVLLRSAKCSDFLRKVGLL